MRGPAEHPSPALGPFAHLPVEVDPQRSGGAALLGEGDPGRLLGQRDLGQSHGLRGLRGGGRRGGNRRSGNGRSGRSGGRRGTRFVDRDAEVAGETGQSAVVALADGPELPGALPAVQLAEHEGRLDGGVPAVEPGEFGSAARVEHPYVQSRHPSEGAAVRGGGDDHRLHGGLHPLQVHREGVGRGAAGGALPLVAHGVGDVPGLVVEDEVVVRADSAGDQQQRRGVHVRDSRPGVPSHLDPDRARRDRNVGAFEHGHVLPLRWPGRRTLVTLGEAASRSLGRHSVEHYGNRTFPCLYQTAWAFSSLLATAVVHGHGNPAE